jgi:DNA-binding winged helix-turn-helix (wHTH) protein
VTTEALRFPPFLLDAANATLWRGQRVIPLPPKAFDALQYLATHQLHEFAASASSCFYVWRQV